MFLLAFKGCSSCLLVARKVVGVVGICAILAGVWEFGGLILGFGLVVRVQEVQQFRGPTLFCRGEVWG